MIGRARGSAITEPADRSLLIEPAAQSGCIVAFKRRAAGTIMSRCSLMCLCGKEAKA